MNGRMTLAGRPGWLTDDTPVRDALDMVHAHLWSEHQRRLDRAHMVAGLMKKPVEHINACVDQWADLTGWLAVTADQLRDVTADQREQRRALAAQIGDFG